MRKAILCLLWALITPQIWAGNVTLAWDPNSESNLAGYKVYYGTASRTYGAPTTIGTQTVFTITNLAPGTTYYFAVTAYNSDGLESGYSNEVSAVITTGLCGDVNGDGVVNILDVQFVATKVNKVFPAADLDKDGLVTSADVLLMAMIFIRTRTCP